MLLDLYQGMSDLCMRDNLDTRKNVIQYIAYLLRNIVFRRDKGVDTQFVLD
jgi:hypothetical protein